MANKRFLKGVLKITLRKFMNLDEKHTKKQAETKDFKLLERFRVKTQAILGLKKYQEKRGQHTTERFGIKQPIWFQKNLDILNEKFGATGRLGFKECFGRIAVGLGIHRAVGVLKKVLTFYNSVEKVSRRKSANKFYRES